MVWGKEHSWIYETRRSDDANSWNFTHKTKNLFNEKGMPIQKISQNGWQVEQMSKSMELQKKEGKAILHKQQITTQSVTKDIIVETVDLACRRFLDVNRFRSFTHLGTIPKQLKPIHKAHVCSALKIDDSIIKAKSELPVLYVLIEFCCGEDSYMGSDDYAFWPIPYKQNALRKCMECTEQSKLIDGVSPPSHYLPHDGEHRHDLRGGNQLCDGHCGAVEERSTNCMLG